MKKLLVLAAVLVSGISAAQAQTTNTNTTTTTTQPPTTTTTVQPNVPVQGQPMQSQGTINQTTTTPATITTFQTQSTTTDTYQPARAMSNDAKVKDKRRKSKMKSDQ